MSDDITYSDEQIEEHNRREEVAAKTNARLMRETAYLREEPAATAQPEQPGQPAPEQAKLRTDVHNKAAIRK